MQPHQPHSHVAMVHVKHAQPDLRPVIQVPAYESEDEHAEPTEHDAEQHAAYLAQMAAFEQKHAELSAAAQAALEDKPPQFYAPGPTPTPAPVAQDQTFRLRRKALPIKK
jgi:hypothetical protein